MFLQKAVLLEDPAAEEDHVMDSLLTLINSLMANAENFLQHGSLSERGGFAVSINGIKVFKVKYFFWPSKPKYQGHIYKMYKILSFHP